MRDRPALRWISCRTVSLLQILHGGVASNGVPRRSAKLDKRHAKFTEDQIMVPSTTLLLLKSLSRRRSSRLASAHGRECG